MFKSIITSIFSLSKTLKTIIVLLKHLNKINNFLKVNNFSKVNNFLKVNNFSKVNNFLIKLKTIIVFLKKNNTRSELRFRFR